MSFSRRETIVEATLTSSVLANEHSSEQTRHPRGHIARRVRQLKHKTTIAPSNEMTFAGATFCAVSEMTRAASPSSAFPNAMLNRQNLPSSGIPAKRARSVIAPESVSAPESKSRTNESTRLPEGIICGYSRRDRQARRLRNRPNVSRSQGLKAALLHIMTAMSENPASALKL